MFFFFVDNISSFSISPTRTGLIAKSASKRGFKAREKGAKTVGSPTKVDWGAGDVSDPRGIIFGYYHNFMGRLGAFKSDCLFEGIFSIRSFFCFWFVCPLHVPLRFPSVAYRGGCGNVSAALSR